jgi:lysophospholipase L1-like esterase
VETLEEVYGYDPVPKELPPADAKHILGAQANLWSCATNTRQRLELQAFPRLCALAEIAWCPAVAKDLHRFQQRLAAHLRRLDVLDVVYWREPGAGEAKAHALRLYVPERPLPAIRATTPVTQDRDRATYSWSTRHQQVLHQLRVTPPDVVMIGDSITHYWGGLPAAPLVRAEDAWQRAFGKRTAVNLGFGWDRTENVLWRIANGELDSIAPKQVVVLIGTNNLELDSPDEVLAGVDAVCRAIHAKLPQARILVLGILPRKDQGRLKADLDKVNYLLQTRLHPRGYIRVVDFGNHFRKADGSLNDSLFSDGLHPNRAGYDLLAKLLAEQVELR